jgi:hypothetical protein
MQLQSESTGMPVAFLSVSLNFLDGFLNRELAFSIWLWTGWQWKFWFREEAQP